MSTRRQPHGRGYLGDKMIDGEELDRFLLSICATHPQHSELENTVPSRRGIYSIRSRNPRAPPEEQRSISIILIPRPSATIQRVSHSIFARKGQPYQQAPRDPSVRPPTLPSAANLPLLQPLLTLITIPFRCSPQTSAIPVPNPNVLLGRKTHHSLSAPWSARRNPNGTTPSDTPPYRTRPSPHN